MKLKISLNITLLLLTLGFTACGPQPANNAAITNSTVKTGNSNSAANSSKSLAEECGTGKDTAIIDAMKASVMKTTSSLYPIRRQFNFYVYGCEVKLVGYVNNLRNFKDLYDLAATSTDVEKIDISGLWLDAGDTTRPSSGTCPGDTVKCNDICLPKGQVCHIGVIPDADVVPSATKKQ